VCTSAVDWCSRARSATGDTASGRAPRLGRPVLHPRLPRRTIRTMPLLLRTLSVSRSLMEFSRKKPALPLSICLHRARSLPQVPVPVCSAQSNADCSSVRAFLRRASRHALSLPLRYHRDRHQRNCTVHLFSTHTHTITHSLRFESALAHASLAARTPE
jgi:hypothetical protein